MGTIVRHGSYGWESKYEIVQHQYICTDCEAPVQGFAEVLEIKNPPLGMSGSLIHIFWDGHGSTYFEFARIGNATNAYQATRSLFVAERMENVILAIVKKPGYISAGRTTKAPWFYETES